MSERGLSAVEAAARLGVKRATLYAYVSRGLLSRTVAADGRTSRFDPAEIDRLRADKRPPAEGELRTVISTQLTRVDDQGLLVRGHDLVGLVGAGASFTEMADLLWAAEAGEAWDRAPLSPEASPFRLPWLTGGAGVASLPLLDAIRMIVAWRSAADPLRHDLSPRSVRAVGRALIVELCRSLPTCHPDPRAQPRPPAAGWLWLAASLWQRLSPDPATDAQLRALDAAMALLVDHGLAGSTFAARIAASVRADPYSVVSAGLGVMGGTLHGAASGSVHELLVEAETTGDAIGAVGAVRRRLGLFPGFGHTVYQLQDPRYGALMAQMVDAWGADPRLVIAYRVRDVVSQRSNAIPNIDLTLGMLSYLAHMPVDAGEVIFSIARIAGWLAHALEEYGEKPLRFRARERYTGPRSG